MNERKLLAKTPTSEVYRIGIHRVLKVFTPLGMADEKFSAVALEYFDGIGAAKVYESSPRTILMEYLSGPNLMGHAEGARILAEGLNKLHSIRKPLPPLLPLKERFFSLFERVKHDPLPLYHRAAEVAAKLLESQKEICVLHGDAHFENFLFCDNRGWLAIDPKGLIGERTYDAANVLLNVQPSELKAQSEILMHTMKLDPERFYSFSFAHACLSACWSIEDGGDPESALCIANKINELAIRQ